MSSKEKKTTKADRRKSTKKDAKKDTKMRKKSTSVPERKSLSESAVMIGRVASRVGQKDFEIGQPNNQNIDDNIFQKTQQSFSPMGQNFQTHNNFAYNSDGFENNNQILKDQDKQQFRNGQSQQYQQFQQQQRGRMPDPLQQQQQQQQQYSQQQYQQQQYQQQQQRSNKFMFDGGDFKVMQPKGMGNYNGIENNMDQNLQSMRMTRIQEQIAINLIPKKDKILQQMQRIEIRIEEIKMAAQKIEKATREECEDIIERLRQATGIKISQLNRELMELRNETDIINEAIEDVHGLNDQNNGQVMFQFENVEKLVYRRLKTSIDVYPNDLPQEYLENRQARQQIQKFQALMDFKNEVIWKLYNEQQQQVEQVKQSLEMQASDEFNNWANLIDEYQEELSQYKVKCCFCGINFDYQLINSNCNFNQQDSNPEIKIRCEIQPPQEFIGTQRHFFAKPLPINNT